MIEIFAVILVLLSFYFSFLPHETQCNMIKWILPNCFPHWLHIGAGIGCFAAAVVIYHNNYLLKLRIQD